MPDVIVGDYLEVKAYCYLDNQLGINVHHAFVVTVPGGTDLEDVAGNFGVYLGNVLIPLLATPAQFLGVSVRLWAPGYPNWATQWSKAGAGPGTAGATPAPKQCSGLISRQTAIGGPGGRGRIYVPFPATADVEPAGNPTAGYLARLGLYGADVTGTETIDAGFSVTFGLMQWRNAGSFKATNTYEERDRFATQRRRGDYGRVNAIPPELV